MSVFRVKNLFVLSLLLAIAIFSSCNKPENGQVEEIVSLDDETVAVEVLAAYRTYLSRELEYSGSLEAQSDVTISAEINGSVKSVNYLEGDYVPAGETIVKLDDVQARLNYNAASAALSAAQSGLQITENPVREGELAQLKSNLDAAIVTFETAESAWTRAQNLYDEGAMSGAEKDAAYSNFEAARSRRDSAQEAYDQALEGGRVEDISRAESAVESARAQVALANDQLNNTNIKTPIDGIITDVWFETGEYVPPGARVFRIVNNQYVELTIGVGDRQVRFIGQGDNVQVTVDAYPGDSFEGAVTRIGVVSNEMTGTYPVDIQIENMDGRLRAGMIARTDLEIEKVEDGIVIPLYALVPSGENFKVFIESDGTVESRNVTPALVAGEFVAILEGIEPDEHVVIRGAGYLNDGDEVRVVNTFTTLDREEFSETEEESPEPLG